MEIELIAQPKKGPRQIKNYSAPIFGPPQSERLTFVVVEGGMQSGEPAVIMIGEDDFGTFVLQTSLDKLIMGTIGLKALAQSRFGWKESEGHATLMPMGNVDRKQILLALKKELEEWEAVSEAGDADTETNNLAAVKEEFNNLASTERDWIRVTQEQMDELDRCARAYGWEVGRGKPLADSFELSPDNPFAFEYWREVSVTNPVDLEGDDGDGGRGGETDPPIQSS